jgi:hypothetical protein
MGQGDLAEHAAHDATLRHGIRDEVVDVDRRNQMADHVPILPCPPTSCG